MALPVAQLGYIPNINAPATRGRYEVRNPWEDFAMQVLGQVVGKAVGNVMQPDLANRAAAEGLTGPSTTPAQMKATPDGGVMTAPEVTTAAPTNAPWWKRALVGPTMSGDQYSQLAGRKAATTEAEKDRQLRREEGGAGREVQMTTAEKDRQAALERVKMQTDAASARHADDKAYREREQGFRESMGQANLAQTAIQNALAERKLNESSGFNIDRITPEQTAKIMTAYEEYRRSKSRIDLANPTVRTQDPDTMTFEEFFQNIIAKTVELQQRMQQSAPAAGAVK